MAECGQYLVELDTGLQREHETCSRITLRVVGRAVEVVLVKLLVPH